MGLGIDIRAAYAGTEEACRNELRAFIENESPAVPGKSVSATEFDSLMRASFFFAEEDVYFQFEEDGTLTISAKTNDVGPGYHAYLVGVLDRMREACGLSWSSDDVEDDTEFWHNRDYEELQHAMAAWLEGLATSLVENHMGGETSGLAICMGTELVPDNNSHYAAHPLGWFERDFFHSIAENGPSPEDCANFFLWWEEDRTPDFFRKCAECMAWCDCNWLPPVTDSEKSLFTSMLSCLETAWDEDPSLHYPVREWKELANLSESVDISVELDRRFPGNTPESEPMGYLRGDVRRNLGSGWRMTMPGAMHHDTDGENNTVLVYWDGERITVRISRFSVTGDNVSAESLLDTITEDVESAVPFVAGEDKDFLARVPHEPQEEEDGTKYFGSFFFAAVDAGKVLYVSVFYDDEADRALAEAMFSSCSWQDF